MKLIAYTILVAPMLVASPIGFDSLADGDGVTTEYIGANFANATVLTSGISLNEFEFPPHSGLNVASDNGGPMGILFTVPVVDFSGYFTYLEPITISAYDSSDNLVASTTSAFSSNLALSGDAGSVPNELLSLAHAPGFVRVVIAGNAAGGSFVVDDVSYTWLETSDVPEPALRWTLLALLAAIVQSRKCRGT